MSSNVKDSKVTSANAKRFSNTTNKEASSGPCRAASLVVKPKDHANDQSTDNYLALGTEVTTCDGRTGIIRYFGPVHFANGHWFGLELTTADGNCSGRVDDITYFNCAQKHGLLIRGNELKPIQSTEHVNSTVNHGRVLSSQREGVLKLTKTVPKVTPISSQQIRTGQIQKILEKQQHSANAAATPLNAFNQRITSIRSNRPSALGSNIIIDGKAKAQLASIGGRDTAVGDKRPHKLQTVYIPDLPKSTITNANGTAKTHEAVKSGKLTDKGKSDKVIGQSHKTIKSPSFQQKYLGNIRQLKANENSGRQIGGSLASLEAANTSDSSAVGSSANSTLPGLAVNNLTYSIPSVAVVGAVCDKLSFVMDKSSDRMVSSYLSMNSSLGILTDTQLQNDLEASFKDDVDEQLLDEEIRGVVTPDIQVDDEELYNLEGVMGGSALNNVPMMFTEFNLPLHFDENRTSTPNSPGQPVVGPFNDKPTPQNVQLCMEKQYKWPLLPGLNETYTLNGMEIGHGKDANANSLSLQDKRIEPANTETSPTKEFKSNESLELTKTALSQYAKLLSGAQQEHLNSLTKRQKRLSHIEQRSSSFDVGDLHGRLMRHSLHEDMIVCTGDENSGVSRCVNKARGSSCSPCRQVYSPGCSHWENTAIRSRSIDRSLANPRNNNDLGDRPLSRLAGSTKPIAKKGGNQIAGSEVVNYCLEAAKCGNVKTENTKSSPMDSPADSGRKGNMNNPKGDSHILIVDDAVQQLDYCGNAQTVYQHPETNQNQAIMQASSNLISSCLTALTASDTMEQGTRSRPLSLLSSCSTDTGVECPFDPHGRPLSMVSTTSCDTGISSEHGDLCGVISSLEFWPTDGDAAVVNNMEGPVEKDSTVVHPGCEETSCTVTTNEKNAVDDERSTEQAMAAFSTKLDRNGDSRNVNSESSKEVKNFAEHAMELDNDINSTFTLMDQQVPNRDVGGPYERPSSAPPVTINTTFDKNDTLLNGQIDGQTDGEMPANKQIDKRIVGAVAGAQNSDQMADNLPDIIPLSVILHGVESMETEGLAIPLKRSVNTKKVIPRKSCSTESQASPTKASKLHGSKRDTLSSNGKMPKSTKDEAGKSKGDGESRVPVARVATVKLLAKTVGVDNRRTSLPGFASKGIPRIAAAAISTVSETKVSHIPLGKIQKRKTEPSPTHVPSKKAAGASGDGPRTKEPRLPTVNGDLNSSTDSTGTHSLSSEGALESRGSTASVTSGQKKENSQRNRRLSQVYTSRKKRLSTDIPTVYSDKLEDNPITKGALAGHLVASTPRVSRRATTTGVGVKSKNGKALNKATELVKQNSRNASPGSESQASAGTGSGVSGSSRRSSIGAPGQPASGRLKAPTKIQPPQPVRLGPSTARLSLGKVTRSSMPSTLAPAIPSTGKSNPNRNTPSTSSIKLTRPTPVASLTRPPQHGPATCTPVPAVPPTRAGSKVPKELAQLEVLCESRTKEVVQLRQHLAECTAGFQAMSVLVNYLTHTLHAFDGPELQSKLERTKQKLDDCELHLTELVKQRDALIQQIQSLTEQHQQDLKDKCKAHLQTLEEQDGRLRKEYQNMIVQVEEGHCQEKKCLKTAHETAIQKYEEALQQKDECHQMYVHRQREEQKAYIHEMQNQHQLQMDDITRRVESMKMNLSSKVESLRLECDELRAREKRHLESYNHDVQSAVQSAIAAYRHLPAEIESLRSVLEMKSQEIHEIRRHKLELEKKLEELPEAKDKISKLEQEIENLQAILSIRSDYEKELSEKYTALVRRVERESKANKRLSMNNEELLWRLHQDDGPHSVSHSPNSSTCSTPEPHRRSTAIQPSPHSPRGNVQRSLSGGAYDTEVYKPSSRRHNRLIMSASEYTSPRSPRSSPRTSGVFGYAMATTGLSPGDAEQEESLMNMSTRSEPSGTCGRALSSSETYGTLAGDKRGLKQTDV